MRSTALLGLVAGLGLTGPGCGTGSVEVVLVNPAAQDARPDPAATVVLRAEPVDDGDDVVLTATVRDQQIDFGDLPVGDYRAVSVEMFGATGVAVGYGRAADPVEVTPDRDQVVSIPVRRPRVYLAGPAPGRVIEAPLDGASAVLVRLDRGGVGIDVDAVSMPAPSAVVAAAGPDMYVVAGGMVHRLDSSNDGFEPTPLIDVGTTVVDLAGSADGRFLVGATATGLEIIDLAARQTRTVPAGAPVDAVATAQAADGSVVAVGLIGAVRTSTGCPGNSQLVVAGLGEGETAGRTIDLGGGVADIAAAPGRPLVVAAGYCQDQVTVVDLASDTIVGALPGVESPTVVAAADDQAWAVGTIAGVVAGTGSAERVTRGAYHQLAVVDLTGAGVTGRVVDFPEIAQTIMPNEPGTSLAQTARAKRAVASSLSLSARGDTLTLSSNGVHRVPRVVLVDGFGIIIGYIFPVMTVHSSFQYGISTRTGAIESVIATRCSVCTDDDGASATLDYGEGCGNLQEDWQFPSWACSPASGVQSVAGLGFEAGASAALYGRP